MSVKGDDIFMRLFVFFDLPVTKKEQRKIAAKFRKNIPGTVISSIRNKRPSPAQICHAPIFFSFWVNFNIFFDAGQ